MLASSRMPGDAEAIILSRATLRALCNVKQKPPLPKYSRGGFGIYAVLRIRAGVAVLHLAAQLIQHFVQCVGGQAADGIGHGFVGLLA